MPDYVRTGTNRTTGQRVGQLSDGSVIPIQESPQSAQPFQSPGLSEFMVPFKSTQRSKKMGLPFELNPDNPLLNPMSIVPDQFVEPAASTAGFVAGQGVPVPFASTGLSMLGSALGQGELQRRKLERGEKQAPFSGGKMAERAGESLIAGGVGKVAQAVPFMTKAGTKIFGKTLENLKGSIEMPEILSQMRNALMSGASDVSGVIHKARVLSGIRAGGQDVIGEVMAKPELTGVTAKQAQDIANAFGQEGSKIGKSFQNAIQSKIVSTFPEVKGLYGNFARAKGIQAGAKTAGKRLPWIIGGAAAYRGARHLEKTMTGE